MVPVPAALKHEIASPRNSSSRTFDICNRRQLVSVDWTQEKHRVRSYPLTYSTVAHTPSLRNNASGYKHTRHFSGIRQLTGHGHLDYLDYLYQESVLMLGPRHESTPNPTPNPLVRSMTLTPTPPQKWARNKSGCACFDLFVFFPTAGRDSPPTQ